MVETIEIAKRYFMLMFACVNCGKRTRFKNLETAHNFDFICPHCEDNVFRIHRRLVTESVFQKKGQINGIIFEETTNLRRVD